MMMDIPSVVIKGGTCLFVISNPLPNPTTAPKSTVNMPTGMRSRLSPFIKVAADTFAVEIIAPTDKSKPPEIITTVCPMAAIPSIEKLQATFSKLPIPKKFTPVSR